MLCRRAFLKNNEEIGLWAQTAGEMISKINDQSLRSEYARGRPLVRNITMG
jgi:hypothetical protein